MRPGWARVRQSGFESSRSICCGTSYRLYADGNLNRSVATGYLAAGTRPASQAWFFNAREFSQSVMGINLDTLRPEPSVEGHSTPGGYSCKAVKPIALAKVTRNGCRESEAAEPHLYICTSGL